MKEIIDLRSDTVTLPTEEMLEAIRNADLGDDVFGEDPLVNRLEEMASQKMGKESALLVPSGTMANLVSVMTNTRRGDCVILEADSHIYWYEAGGISAIAGVLPWPIRGVLGAMDPNDVEAAIKSENVHFPRNTLVCIENTHNRAGGTIVSPSRIRAISEIAHAHELNLYMDGARIFNAAVALNIDIKEFTKHVDSLMFCLSKGLSCPIGSVIVGNEEFIARARKNRKIVGGGMRQAGVIAAPGIIALEKMVDRLAEDHRNAAILGKGLSRIDGISINLKTVQTNMALFEIKDLGIRADVFLKKMKEHGLLALSHGPGNIRLVTHRGIEREHIEKALDVISELADEIRSQKKPKKLKSISSL